MKLLSREDLLKREDLKVEKVEFEDGNYVYVREMTAFERDKFEQSLRKEIKTSKGEINFEVSLDNFRAKLAVFTLCDEKGDLLLQPNEYEQLSKSISVDKMEKIFKKASELNAVFEIEKEELLKNLNSGGAVNSNSVSAES